VVEPAWGGEIDLCLVPSGGFGEGRPSAKLLQDRFRQTLRYVSANTRSGDGDGVGEKHAKGASFPRRRESRHVIIMQQYIRRRTSSQSENADCDQFLIIPTKAGIDDDLEYEGDTGLQLALE